MDETEEGVCDKETELVTIGPCLKASALHSEETVASSREDLYRVGQRHGQSQKVRKAWMVGDKIL